MLQKADLRYGRQVRDQGVHERPDNGADLGRLERLQCRDGQTQTGELGADEGHQPLFQGCQLLGGDSCRHSLPPFPRLRKRLADCAGEDGFKAKLQGDAPRGGFDQIEPPFARLDL